ncbi:iron donor protein CyaY [Amphritea pacifica]|uniref:Iron-sulfur cluster assembly protein CyaY n=1 Tax=Amphritea pacifica TaxID=2811233 RepID=A0ABS2W9J0_9GAMM|nr:iron donor protein CyaY [Amphritea pacifica]MBN0988384.1 iron donor protein CyaY [Amphritea pacifica]MBN1006640.1 iron donor protein CyaY [Amphritea pacifica]
MNESEFNQRVDNTLEQIEEVLDEAETDLDVINNGGVLTVICENKSQVILTRQTPVKQLWLAARSGGFHFDFDGETWVRDSDGAPLNNVLQEILSEQAGEPFSFDL